MAKDNSENFESKILELESIVRKLEEGNVSLEESKIIFKDGVEIVKRCNKILKNTELEITDLKEELEKDFSEQ